ncbi:flavin-containing monooxygenase [Nocardia cerradoensis]|uniref:Phenylacetone monooxygenase n=1 Tax=Nocardia cerradoensis TaxID=85688 RepID=A0A231GV82_9NOCA|nr:NAD(P)/FAD-dependent oxidoreductase [Nocardia cerradoensis]NKY43616.1 NAD(P)/FAD-dependent oxidoreductase [Nocardia cerradoensis]OXR40455.1 Phenylacetone monooxygenase [Nocardia cerradoensis]
MTEGISIDRRRSVDVVIVGAGFAGLYAIYRLRGQGLSVRCVEAAEGVGGTWFWNRYPGARCDVESIDYSYSFDPSLEQEWDWTERYAAQPEILRYLEHVADRYDLRRSITFGTRVIAARFEEEIGHWLVELADGSTLTARFVVFATGTLSAVHAPNLPGLETFTGRTFHTARWPHEDVDFTGRRVGVIGTGSSGIQIIPILAERADHLTVFQRSANFSIPSPNGPHTAETRAAYRASYAERRRLSWDSGGGSPHRPHDKGTFEVSEQERLEIYERQWQLGGVLFSKAFPDQMNTDEANAPAREFFAAKVRTMIEDPALAAKLIPTDHAIGTKRICTDSGYYPTFNRPNVALADLREAPIDEVTPTGVRRGDIDHPIDDLIFATGFDALTGALAAIDIRGRAGHSLRDEWAAGPRTYLGIEVAGFPNMFIVNGPGSASTFTNMVLSAEHQVDWIGDTITHLDSRNLWGIEATSSAQDKWVRHCAELAENTLFPRANSWYMGANVPGKPRVFMPYLGGFATYRKRVAESVAEGYRGFALLRTP